MRGPRPYPGRVVQIRVSPTDCMACIDLVKSLEPERPWGALPPGSSFAQCVSFALRVFCESARLSKTVPTREGFEFTEMMNMWPDTPGAKAQARKVDISRTMERALGEAGRVPNVRDLPRGRPGQTAAQMRANRRVDELLGKKVATPDSWMPADEEELKWQIQVGAGEIDPLDETKWPAALRP